MLDRVGVSVLDEPTLYLAHASEHISEGRLNSTDARQTVEEIVTALADTAALKGEPVGVAG